MVPRLERHEHHRQDETKIAQALRKPTSCFILFEKDRGLLRRDAMEPVVLAGRELAVLGLSTDRAVFLGVDGDATWFGLDVSDACIAGSLERHAGGRFCGLGSIEDPVDPQAWAVLAQARALLAWNRETAYCPACGSETDAAFAGYMRRCSDPDCAKTHFPRTDPAVIVRVHHGERCLLARSPRFRPAVRSMLAGFVEPGECLEDAVRREVSEEVGLNLLDVRYLGSQPWPFPMSIMIAFEAHATSDTLCLDPTEIEAADWYSRDRVRSEVASGRLRLSSRKSISRWMLDTWLNTDGSPDDAGETFS